VTAPVGTFLGFDYGGRRLGVAVGESVTGAARPLVTLPSRDGQPDWTEVERLISEWRPAALVVGVPFHADGSESTSTRGARRLARRLSGRTGLVVHEVDERLSSHEAAQRLRAAGHGVTSARDKQRLDAVAAQVILETWFQQQGVS